VAFYEVWAYGSCYLGWRTEGWERLIEVIVEGEDGSDLGLWIEDLVGERVLRLHGTHD
jgi:hypothetical protein